MQTSTLKVIGMLGLCVPNPILMSNPRAFNFHGVNMKTPGLPLWAWVKRPSKRVKNATYSGT